MKKMVTQVKWALASRRLLPAIFIAMTGAGIALADGEMHKSKPFSGAKVNGGMVAHEMKDGKHLLALSDDFKVPETPDPHWQIVDSKGNVYLMPRLLVKDDKLNKSITVPSYVYDIAKVQIWCAYAEVVLGETTFDPPIR